MRTVSDTEGRVWRVWHVVPQSAVLLQTQPRMSRGWLCFESDGDKRRLAEPPGNWAAMSDGELLALMGRAAEAKRVEARVPQMG